jgi:hypothetical protein
MSSTSLALAQASMVMLVQGVLAETTSTVCIPLQVQMGLILGVVLSENTGVNLGVRFNTGVILGACHSMCINVSIVSSVYVK